MELKDAIIVVNMLATAFIALFLKFFYSELRQRDIKIDHIDKRLGEVEKNYNTKFDKVYVKQDAMTDKLDDIKSTLVEVSTTVKDQKEFCRQIQSLKKNGRKT